eukprot:1191286-Prymnesium_polylepis.2
MRRGAAHTVYGVTQRKASARLECITALRGSRAMWTRFSQDFHARQHGHDGVLPALHKVAKSDSDNYSCWEAYWAKGKPPHSPPPTSLHPRDCFT